MISQGFLGNLGSMKSTPQSYVQAYFVQTSTCKRPRALPDHAHQLDDQPGAEEEAGHDGEHVEQLLDVRGCRDVRARAGHGPGRPGESLGNHENQ